MIYKQNKNKELNKIVECFSYIVINPRLIQKTIKILSVSVVILLATIVLSYFNPSHAGGIEDSMKSFWDDMGAGGNINSPHSYQGQSAGYYTLGSIHQRNKVMTVNPVNLQLPSARAGCGGIDLYLGSFSYINKDQFVALMKNIATNSMGFAFQLALETISPVIAEKTRELQDIIQKMNNFSINSCEQSAALVGGMWPKSDQASQAVCSTLGNNKGLFADATSAKHGCSSGGKRASTLNQIDDKVKPVDVNYSWNALKESGVLMSGGSFDTKTAELFMTMTGTIIVKNATSDNASPITQHKPALVNNKEFITKMLDGGDVQIYKCDEANKCLNPVKTNYTISDTTAFKKRVSEILESIKNKIVDDSPLSMAEVAFLNTTTIPVYKILNVYSAYAVAVSSVNSDTLAEVIALDILYNYLEEFLKTTRTASNSLMIADEENLAKFKKNLRTNIAELEERKRSYRESFSATMELVNRTQQIEQLLSNKLTTQMSDTLNWSKAMGR